MLLNYFNDPTILIVASLIMVMALIFHNMVQAYVARRYGDLTATYQGFGKFDPQTHLEPMGVFFLLLLGFGWPKQVPVNGRNLPGRGRSEAIVWYAGPASYLMVATVSWFFAVLFNTLGGGASLVGAFVVAGNVAIRHAVVNLFPVLPLDGARAALAWGSPQVRRVVQQIAGYGFIGFIVIFLLLSSTGILGAVERFFADIILGSIQAIFRAFSA
ncbi:MAG: site-2 protease family protein [bacterium]|nr:site-2 protease family protein [bacterium]